MENNQQNPQGKTALGLSPNIEALLCYLGFWITGLIFFVLEPKDRYIRFHALQSMLVLGGLSILSVALSIAVSFLNFIPFVSLLTIPLNIINFAIRVIILILWIILMVKAYQGSLYKMPIVGDIAERQTENL